MKIKITLIAFLASAMMFTSCMKNETSPGIEKVREAYASLLLAKAQAEVIIATADAAYTNALAAVELANAAIAQAQADGEVADTERLRAELANDMLTWAAEIAAAELLAEQALAAYELEVIAANNVLAIEYFEGYVDALGDVRDAQQAIFDLNADILELGLDIANGTTNLYDGLVADLAAANALLEVLQAEYVTAQALLGNVDAINARIAELAADTVVLGNTVLLLTAELAECAPSYATEAEAATAAATAAGNALTALNNANAAAVYETAREAFETEYDLPEWWEDAQTAIDDAQTALDDYDTATAGSAYWGMKADIENGTDDLDQDILDLEALIALEQDTIDQALLDSAAAELEILAQLEIIAGLAADTVAAATADTLAQEAAAANEAAVTALEEANTALGVDTTNLNAETAALTALLADAITDQETAAGGTPFDAADSLDVTWLAYETIIQDYTATIAANNAAVVTKTGEINLNLANITILEAAQAGLDTARAATLLAFNNAVDAYNDGDDAPLAEIIDQQAIITQTSVDIATAEGNIEGFEGEITGLEGDIETRLEDIAQWEIDIVDIYSTYLMTLTFVDELEADLQAAKDAKEDLREDYETYMDEFFATYWDGLKATAATALTTYNTAAAANVTAQAALVEAMAPCTAIQTALTAAQNDLGFAEEILELYQGVGTYNEDYLEDFATAITEQMEAIAEIEEDIAETEQAYIDGLVTYDEYLIDMVSLEAELATATSYVAYWKALLDEVLAN